MCFIEKKIQIFLFLISVFKRLLSDAALDYTFSLIRKTIKQSDLQNNVWRWLLRGSIYDFWLWV